MDKVAKILHLLKENYPEAKTSLNYKNPFEFLVAVILSARSTDEQVNRITPDLFTRYNTAFKMSRASVKDIEKLIKRCGLYRNKSRNLVNMAVILVERYGGDVPDELEELLLLPGVGRKTANVVISNLYGKPAIAVDTHVYRVSRRLGLANGKSAPDVEKELMKIIPRHLWAETHHRLIAHGRTLCYPRNPRCNECFLKKNCCQEGL